jgi:dethiobiotin synthetase
VVGTGTDIGKTWVSARLLTALRQAGATVAARKPAQSFEPADDRAGLDSALLAAASGEPPETVCGPDRWYEVAMAPPMAADALGRDPFTIADIVAELAWPAGGVEVGLVETAGGVRSPQSHDGDAVALAAALDPDLVVLVADAGLGTINAVRLSVDVLPAGTVVVLNRYDPDDPLHAQNRRWLTERDGMAVVTLPGQEAALAALAQGR